MHFQSLHLKGSASFSLLGLYEAFCIFSTLLYYFDFMLLCFYTESEFLFNKYRTIAHGVWYNDSEDLLKPSGNQPIN